MDKDSEIDFHKLEREFQSAVEADAKYQRENAAKFRAVEQRVGSYEEFKDIVAASHLKPLEKHDRIGKKKIKQHWNALSCQKSPSQNTEMATTPLGKTNSNVPHSQHEFNKVWTRQLKTKEQKNNYLLQIGGVHLGKIFKTDICVGLLGEFITVLYDHLEVAHTDEVSSILWNLSLSNRFSLSLEFLSKQEKTCLDELFIQL
ncbi:predicted protein, partial [Nematostella vectensis]